MMAHTNLFTFLGHLAASFDGLRPLLVACHCQPFCSLANKLRSFVRSATNANQHPHVRVQSCQHHQLCTHQNVWLQIRQRFLHAPAVQCLRAVSYRTMWAHAAPLCVKMELTRNQKTSLMWTMNVRAVGLSQQSRNNQTITE